jgi:hypothetical protein
METGQPEAKRQRLGEPWHSYPSSRSLPPLPHSNHPLSAGSPGLPSGPPAHLPPRPLSHPSAHPAHASDDRQHHEPYATVYTQDPIRPPSTAPSVYPTFPTSRDPSIKRDLADESPYPAGPPRTNSNGAGVEHHVNQPPDDPRRPQMANYEAVNGHIPSPNAATAYRPAAYPPGPPMAHGLPYDQSPYGPPTANNQPESMYAPPRMVDYASASALRAEGKKKGQRASQVRLPFSAAGRLTAGAGWI